MFRFANRVTERSLHSLFISHVIIAHIGTQRSYFQLLLCLKNDCHAKKNKSLETLCIKAHLPLIFNAPQSDMLMKGFFCLFIIHFERYTCGKSIKLLKLFNSFFRHTKKGGTLKEKCEVHDLKPTDHCFL